MKTFYVFLEIYKPELHSEPLEEMIQIEAENEQTAWLEVRKQLFFNPYISINDICLINIIEERY